MNSQETLEMLETRITRWKWCIASIALILVIGYFFYFAYHLEQNPAKDADKWGQFGDFFGGILNPLVAFAAFYWLTKSVSLQNSELEATREAVQDSAKSQDIQAKNSNKNIGIAARTALINALQSQIDAVEKDLKSLEQALGKDNRSLDDLDKKLKDAKKLWGTEVQVKDLEKKIESLNDSIQLKKKSIKVIEIKQQAMVTECSACLQELRVIVAETRDCTIFDDSAVSGLKK